MNIGEIMKKLQKDHVWESNEQDSPELEPCPFCRRTGSAKIIVCHPVYGRCGAWVRCCSCGAYGPAASIYATIITPGKLSTPLLPESLERGIAAAQDAWNGRTVDCSRMSNMKITKELPA